MAEIFSDYWASFAAFTAFGLLHSICAQDGFKHALASLIGHHFVEHYWRLLYCVASYWGLYHVVSRLHWQANPESNLWLLVYPDWLWHVMVVLHLVAIAIIYAAFLQSDYLEFWGLKQAWRGTRRLCAGEPARALRLFGRDRLEVRGLYAFVRHPMLAGGLLFLLTSGPSRNNLVFLVMYSAYMLAGGWFEERRLLRVFGEDYARYRRKVGAFVPRLRRRMDEAAG